MLPEQALQERCTAYPFVGANSSPVTTAFQCVSRAFSRLFSLLFRTSRNRVIRRVSPAGRLFGGVHELRFNTALGPVLTGTPSVPRRFKLRSLREPAVRVGIHGCKSAPTRPFERSISSNMAGYSPQPPVQRDGGIGFSLSRLPKADAPSPHISPSRLLMVGMRLRVNDLPVDFDGPESHTQRWPRPRWSLCGVDAHARCTIDPRYASAREHAHAAQFLRDDHGPW